MTHVPAARERNTSIATGGWLRPSVQRDTDRATPPADEWLTIAARLPPLSGRWVRREVGGGPSPGVRWGPQRAAGSLGSWHAAPGAAGSGDGPLEPTKDLEPTPSSPSGPRDS
jgi:hypothetical protein